MRTFLPLIASVFLLSACQSHPEKTMTSVSKNIHQDSLPAQTLTLKHAYQTEIFDQTKSPLSVEELAIRLQDFDVVFIGEYHGNHGSHLLQMQLQSTLYDLRPQQILSMEMFNRDQQAILNRYLDDEIGEKYLINETPTWPNYAGSYRPMVEFAKQHFIPVIAANAAADIVRCVGRYGKGYLDLLPSNERIFTAQDSFLNDTAYQEKFYDFMDSMRKMPDEHKASSYAAQLARDNTMAESILKALKEHPNHQVIHLNGSFHSEQHLGTVALLQQRDPALKIAVISPIRSSEDGKFAIQKADLALGDYVYYVRPQPEEYIDASYRRKAMQSMFKNSSEKAKSCLQP